MSVLCSNTYIQFCNILSRVSDVYTIYSRCIYHLLPDGQTSLFKLSCHQAAASESGEAAPCRATLEGKVDCFTRFAGFKLYILLLLPSRIRRPALPRASRRDAARRAESTVRASHLSQPSESIFPDSVSSGVRVNSVQVSPGLGKVQVTSQTESH